MDKTRSVVVGADALPRMFDPQWGLSVDRVVSELESLDARFLVFGRYVDGSYVDSATAVSGVPEAAAKHFLPMPGRWDVSSSELRAAAATDSGPVGEPPTDLSEPRP